MSNSLLAHAQGKFHNLWHRGLHWAYSEGDKTKGDNPVWSKKCMLFEVYLTFLGQIDEGEERSNYYEVTILIGPAFGSEALYVSPKFVSPSADNARTRADEIVGMFIRTAVSNWLGFEFQTTQPADELRFKQITAGNDGKVYGLDAEGCVHILNGGQASWRKLPMNKDSKGA